VNASTVPDDPLYSEEVRRLFETTPAAGAPKDRTGWVQGEASDPLTETRVRWYLRVRDGRIADARYEVRGCPHTIAVTARLAAGLVGHRVEVPSHVAGGPALPGAAGTPGPAGQGARPGPSVAVDVDLAAVASELNVPAEKLGRLFVIEDAIRRAVLLLRGMHA
jgi:hypothetical protein